MRSRDIFGKNAPAGTSGLSAVLGLIALVALGGCATNPYVDPKLPDSAVAIVEVGSTQLFSGTTPLAVDQIDGEDGGIAYDQIVPFSTKEYRVLPGTHSFVLDAPGAKGIFSNLGQNRRFEVTATVAANKRYRFVGRREPISAKGLLVGVLTGDIASHVELVNETDGGTMQYVQEVPLGGMPGIGPQTYAAYPATGLPTLPDSEPEPLPPPPPPMTYDRWMQQNGGAASHPTSQQ